MESELRLKIILVKPNADVVFGLQKGSGSNYETVQKQISNSQDLSFAFSIKVKGDRAKDSLPKFSGVFVQGTSDHKFIYVDIGTCAGQTNTMWSRRLKIPLIGIAWTAIDYFTQNPDSIIEARVPGTGKDGGPNCATVKPFDGWHHKSL
jgi:hypothetical protein